MSVAISVLIPVYNVEKTLDRCIQSILKQTFHDYEVVLIDDGSTDKSGAMCDEYARKYSNFRVIHKTNEGLGPTRNRGIIEAIGEYIYHCDSDDWLKEDLLQNAYTAITVNKSDIVIFGYDIFTEKNNIIKIYDTIRISSMTYTNKNDIRKMFINQYYNSFIVMSACNRLYRRLFLIENKLFFPSLRRCQDMAYSLLLFDYVEKLTTLHEAYYCYLIEPGIYKGRSYQEMLNIYIMIYQQTSETFIKWGLYTKDEEQKLINRICQQIANYSAHAFAVKYRDNWRELATSFLKNDQTRDLLTKYENSKSKFMALFCLGVRIHSKYLLLAAAKIQQKRIQKLKI